MNDFNTKLVVFLAIAVAFRHLSGLSTATVAQIAMSIYIVYTLIPLVFNKDLLSTFVSNWRSFRWWMVPLNIAVLASIIIVGGYLYSLSPILEFGWTKLVFGEAINLVAAPLALANPSTAGSSSIKSLASPILSTLFLVLLLLALPKLAYFEEEYFRKNKLNMRQILPASIFFGLANAIMGIPIAYALALSIAGLAYSYLYKSSYANLLAQGRSPSDAATEALDIPTAAHTAHNSVIVLGLIVLTWIPI